MAEGCLVGPDSRRDAVKYVWERGIFTGGRIVSVKLPGTNPVTIQQQLSKYSLEHQEVAKVLDPDRKYIPMRGGRYPGVGNVLSGIGTSGDFFLDRSCDTCWR